MTLNSAPVSSVRTATSPLLPAEPVQAVDAAGRLLADVKTAIGAVIFGQDDVVLNCLTALLAGGHVLLIGVPGLAKTRLVETIGTVLGLQQKRIQCTPDLMPSDILGVEVLEETPAGARQFRFIPGPVFSQLLMADEINRASPRTQSALLQAMQENTVTVSGHDHALPAPFHVLATQNPLEQEGTYPLPEAQLDRFLMQVNVGYPSLDAERQMLLSTTMGASVVAKPILNGGLWQELQQLVRQLPLSDKVMEAMLTLVRQGRAESTTLDAVKKYVVWGPGPRAVQALSLAARALSLLDGRLSPSVEDVKALALPVLQHRMALNYTARADNVALPRIIHLLTEALD
ncbi:MAG: MoxR family ATPase [Alphaproteobacteria bacterium]|nr:MoxR family ATPase [Alphaproteobacteria bacterium]